VSEVQVRRVGALAHAGGRVCKFMCVYACVCEAVQVHIYLTGRHVARMACPLGLSVQYMTHEAKA